MKKNKTTHILTAILILFLFTVCNNGKAKERDISHSNTSEFNFSEYLKKYPGLKDLSSTDLKLKKETYKNYEVKNDKGATEVRITALFELFPENIKQEMGIGNFIEKLKTTEWIEKKDFSVMNKMDSDIPIRFISGRTMFIRIANTLSEKISIYFRTDVEVDENTIFFYLKSGEPMTAWWRRKINVEEAALFMDIKIKK